MKRPKHVRRIRPALRRTIQALAPHVRSPRMDGRVTLAVIWALGRLAQRLGPA